MNLLVIVLPHWLVRINTIRLPTQMVNSSIDLEMQGAPQRWGPTSALGARLALTAGGLSDLGGESACVFQVAYHVMCVTDIEAGGDHGGFLVVRCDSGCVGGAGRVGEVCL
mgnify:FL=1